MNFALNDKDVPLYLWSQKIGLYKTNTERKIGLYIYCTAMDLIIYKIDYKSITTKYEIEDFSMKSAAKGRPQCLKR